MGLLTRLFAGAPQDNVGGAPKSAALPALTLHAASPSMPGPESRQNPVLSDIFTPTRPQKSSRRVSGRQNEMLRIFRALVFERAHVVLYGERGRGKTSIINLVAGSARSIGYIVARYACSVESTYDDIIRGLARDLPVSLLAVPLRRDEDLVGCEAALPDGRLQPRDIAGLPGRLIGKHVILIIDEFDRVEDVETRTRFADTIKQVSDRGSPLSFVIVGVSDSLDELLGRHPSIQRNILGLPIPLLTDDKIEEILTKGAGEANIEFPLDIRQSIVATARGVPYIAQLLGLHAGIEAATRGETKVGASDLCAACLRALEEMDPRVAVMYARLVGRAKDEAMRVGLLGIASGQQDRFGRFVVADTKAGHIAAGQPLTRVQWSRMLEIGAFRPCPSAGLDVYAFGDAMLQHHILLLDTISRSSELTDDQAIAAD